VHELLRTVVRVVLFGEAERIREPGVGQPRAQCLRQVAHALGIALAALVYPPKHLQRPVARLAQIAEQVGPLVRQPLEGVLGRS
jgi:hypothetical protein